MDVTVGLMIIGGIYCVLYFFDTFFKSCAHYPYIQFLRGTGLEVKPFQLRWHTTAFNRILVRWGNSKTKFFNLWFNIGMIVSLVLLPFAVVMLLIAFVQNFGGGKEETNFAIEPVLPGINLPVSELGYYSASLIICSVIHEMGHALASVQEDVHIIDFGVCVFLILPVAYVQISTDNLNGLHKLRALKILCAGVWHNLVLSVVAYLLYCLLPILFSLFFQIGHGITVADMLDNSPLAGPKGLKVGDTILDINECPVLDDRNWEDCLDDLRFVKPGFCVNSDLVHNLDESVDLWHLPDGYYDCCASDKSDHICFEYNKDGVVELPPHMCLPVRIIVESSVSFCDPKYQECPEDYHCIRPLLNNVTNLFKISVLDKADVLYIGSVGDLLRTVRISSFIPKYFFSTTTLPDMLEKMLLYLIVFSSGLALVNVIPCVYMDGQHIVKCIVQIFLRESPQYVSLVAGSISLVGTVVIVFHCLISVYRMMNS